jgi:D-lactate dehydrogenase (cytochrome)
MAQFPDVGRAVDAVQEILRTPYGANIRLFVLSLGVTFSSSPIQNVSSCWTIIVSDGSTSLIFFHGLSCAVMNAINKAGTTQKPYPTQDTLFFKIQGAPEAISRAAEVIGSIVKKHASSRFEFASTEEQAKEMWENRKMALFSSLQLEQGLRCWTTDVWFISLLSLRAVRLPDCGPVSPYPGCHSWCTKQRKTSLNTG